MWEAIYNPSIYKIHRTLCGANSLLKSCQLSICLFWSYKVSIPGLFVKKATKSGKVGTALNKFTIYYFQNIPVGTWLPWNSFPEPLYTNPPSWPDITGKAIFLLPLLLSSLIFGTKGPGWLPGLYYFLTGTADVSHRDREGIPNPYHVLPSHCSSLEAMTILAPTPAQPPRRMHKHSHIFYN